MNNYKYSHFWHDSQLAGLPKNFPKEGEEGGGEGEGGEGEGKLNGQHH